MRYLLAILTLLTCQLNGQFIEEFGDMDLGSNPVWRGDTQNFVFIDPVGIRLNANSAGKSTIYTQSTISLAARWQIDLEMLFNPSSSNYSEVYLASSDSLFTAQSIKMIIGKNSDKVELKYCNSNIEYPLAETQAGILNYSTNKIQIAVERMNSKWLLEVTVNDTLNYSSSSEMSIDYFNGQYFGISSIYTSTRADKFIYSSVKAIELELVDDIPPSLLAFEIKDNKSATIRFSERVKKIAPGNLKILPPVYLDSITSQDQMVYSIYFSQKLQSGLYYKIEIDTVLDYSQNMTLTLLDSSLYYLPKKGDLRINEIMFDPTENSEDVYFEFIELINSSPGIVNLKHYGIEVDGKRLNLNNTELQSSEKLVICNVDTTGGINLLKNIKHQQGNFNYLKNTGSDIELKILMQDISVDKINYSSIITKEPEYKHLGGWSLELKNPQDTCEFYNNWEYSCNASGHTMGLENSPRPDYWEFQNKYGLIRVENNSSKGSIGLLFDRKINTANMSCFSNLNGDLQMQLSEDFYGQNHLQISYNVDSAISEFYISLVGIIDCNGDAVYVDTLFFKQTEPPSFGDVVINELLFDPFPGVSQFIELKNISNKAINLKDLCLSNFEYQNETLAFMSIMPISATDKTLMPGDYLVLCREAIGIIEKYPNTVHYKFAKMNSMPKMNSDQGKIALIDNLGNLIDKVYYDENMHFKMLEDDKKEGVSLEKIDSFDLSNNYNNWTSASDLCKGATPSLTNSHSITMPDEKSYKISLENKIISPNNDGYFDQAIVRYSLESSPAYINAYVFDLNGQLIAKLLSNTMVGTMGSIIWDSKDTYGQKASPGTYVLYVEIHQANAKLIRRKFAIRVI